MPPPFMMGRRGPEGVEHPIAGAPTQARHASAGPADGAPGGNAQLGWLARPGRIPANQPSVSVGSGPLVAPGKPVPAAPGVQP